ncbi:hypothetical protein D9757_011513 [Collybiopsis confluens]|uniref:Uncharacterized protein n=1 Tax=Collybiopsis confluens TaxID=2823264 RepID=A0A8H5H7H9_9AGAR|nr:hypothetical protein D9757_011513 [Collybiopsis confluens]
MSRTSSLKGSNSVVDVEAVEVEAKPSRKLRSYIWDTWDKSPEERQFLNKLDSCLLTYAALSYFSK